MQSIDNKQIGGGNRLSRNRVDIIASVGRTQLQSNIENDEWSYNELLKKKKIDRKLVTVNGTVHKNLDLRFADDRVSVLIETKQNYDTCLEAAMKQLQCYVEFEKVLARHNRIIAILANTNDNRIMVWRGDVCEENFLKEETELRKFREYVNLYFGNTNDKEKVIQSTYYLNKVLHRHNIRESLRSLLVGTCLLALKNGLVYENYEACMIVFAIKSNLGKMLERTYDYATKASKVKVIEEQLLESQDVESLTTEGFYEILDIINNDILPYINDEHTKGQDILSMFFSMFNKYVYTDKNQVFTPDHIVRFMTKAVGVNRNTRVLDPCCGSGSFLVRALTEAIGDCRTAEQIEYVKANNIYGIEDDKSVCGLAMMNMLIHGDGNSNLRNDNCFSCDYWIDSKNIDIVLMNPPYNAKMNKCHPSYVATWPQDSDLGEDPTKGLHFVEHIANVVGQRGVGKKLAAILPVQCALNTSKEIKAIKKRLLENHHLDAVFTYPPDLFYPTGVQTICMIFDLGVRHDSAQRKKTFFGYYKNDGFTKRKNYGRVEQESVKWDDTEKTWLEAYFDRKEIEGFCTNAVVSAEDDWVAEAYLETDYSSLTRETYRKLVRKYIANKILLFN